VGLAHHPRLETLNVKSLAITDVGVRALACLSKLDLVVFSRPRFSHDALEALRRALPRCEVVVDGTILPR
jgi:hypothetical protein